MKYRKLRFLSVVCVASLLISQEAIAAYSVGDSDPDPTSGYSESETTPIIINDVIVEVDEKEYDGNTTANATITINSDLVDPESTQSENEEFPLTLKLSLPSSDDVSRIHSIDYYIILDDGVDYSPVEEIKNWYVINTPNRSNINNKFDNKEQILQLTKSDYQKILNFNNFHNNIIHIQSNIIYDDKTTKSKDIVIHVDKQSPAIGTFEVSKTNDSVEDIIHILTFGIFCNN